MVFGLVQKGLKRIRIVIMENSSRFFENHECSFFPCHKLEGDFNCLFCYCPFYTRIVCPGNPEFIKKEDGRVIKKCTGCTFPHKPENYERIMSLLRSPKQDFTFEEYHHGGEKDFCLDFSVNTNPLGVPESVKSALKDSDALLEKYPDQNCTQLRQKLAEKLSVQSGAHLPAENIVFGNGASELISLVAEAVSPKNALIVSPAFSGYERALKICDCRVVHHVLKKENDFILDEKIFDLLEERPGFDMIFVCSPCNPTGRMIRPQILKKLLEVCEEKGIFLFVDECFIDFTECSSESALRFVEKNPHLVVLNAFTKIYAMAGLRLGYAVSSNQGLLQRIKMLAPEWNVSTVAQKAGLAALDEQDYIEETRGLIKREREFLSAELKTLGFKVYSGEANFILFEDEPEREGGEKLDSALMESGILIRNCGNFLGLNENFYRVAVKTHAENEKLIHALAKLRG